MRKIYFVIIIIVLMLNSLSYANRDFQIWNTDNEEFKFNKNTKVVLEQEFRLKDNASVFSYQHYDLGVVYSLNNNWSFGTGYRHIYEKKDEFKLENTPYLTCTLSLDLLGFKFDSRNRFEYRHFDYQDDSYRYRNRFTLKLAQKFTNLQIQPYLSDEVFMSFAGGNNNEFNQNRFCLGFAMHLIKKLSGDIYYMLLSTKSNSIWTDANVLGTKFKIAF